MLDINFIRENTDLVKEAVKKKRIELDVDEFLKKDSERRILIRKIEEKRAEQNRVGNAISSCRDDLRRKSLVEEMRALKDGMKDDEEYFKTLVTDWKNMMLAVPNIPDMSVPDGKGEEDNLELKTWGEKPQFSFEPKDHVEIMKNLDMVDFERGTKVHGFRGYFLKNEGADMSWAVWNYAREFFGNKNFVPFIAPAIVKKEFFYGTGHLPADAEDLFKTQDDDYLSGTSEVAMMAYHSEEILKKEDLPKRYLAFSPCYRREAGSHGKDTKGLIRVHEFYKLEQLVLCHCDHAESVKIHEELNRNTEEFVESLCIPYRQLAICTGDLKKAQVKSYDTELWMPSQNSYREIASASYYHDFQTRRFNIRYDDGDKKRYAHSLNATAIPTPRVLSAIVENYQQEDGSVLIPKVLQKYMGKEKIERKI
ncbi:MAG: serine--tRNA ligase [bacterium]|nr:serine--tRNA ligase [bacterium]